MQNRRHPAGGGHRHGDVLRVQPCQNFVQSGLFGRRCLKRLFRLCVQRLDDSIRVAVFPVEAAQHRPHGISRRAAGGNVQPLLIRKPKGSQRRLPQGGPHPLGVEHQAVHIKNNAVDHGSISFHRKAGLCPAKRSVSLLYHRFGSLHTTVLTTWCNLPGGKMKHFAIPCKTGREYYNRNQHLCHKAPEIVRTRIKRKRETHYVGYQDHPHGCAQGKAHR